jgi:V8-like Glu-specific endopeptidase
MFGVTLGCCLAKDSVVILDATKRGSASRSFIPLPAYDSVTNSDFVPHSVGTLPNGAAFANSSFPYEEIECKYSDLVKASDYFDLGSFPARANVFIFYADNGEWHKHASGTLISPRHVLTAAHNVQFGARWWGEDSLRIIPAWDYGRERAEIGSTISTKAYYLTERPTQCCYGSYRHDFAVLELRDPIGEKTGWLGYGFQPKESFSGKRMHWFSYPGVPTPDSSRYFNGDTMFYSTMLNSNESCVYTRFDGIPGQSGSNVFCETSGSYVIYWNISMGFQRINAKVFSLIKFAIADSSNSSSIRNHLYVSTDSGTPLSPVKMQMIRSGIVVCNGPSMYNLLGRRLSDIQNAATLDLGRKR